MFDGFLGGHASIFGATAIIESDGLITRNKIESRAKVFVVRNEEMEVRPAILVQLDDADRRVE